MPIGLIFKLLIIAFVTGVGFMVGGGLELYKKYNEAQNHQNWQPAVDPSAISEPMFSVLAGFGLLAIVVLIASRVRMPWTVPPQLAPSPLVTPLASAARPASEDAEAPAHDRLAAALAKALAEKSSARSAATSVGSARGFGRRGS